MIRTSADVLHGNRSTLRRRRRQNEDETTITGQFNAVNEQTRRGGTSLSWSKTGNLTEDDTSGGGQTYAYDRANLLTQVKDSVGTTIQEAKYDALGRRIEVYNPSAGTTTRFYWDTMPTQSDPDDSFKARIIETTDGSDNVRKAFVWGNYIDELLLMEDTAGDGGTAGADYYALRHHNYKVVALTDSSGSVQERYDYNPYGERFVLDADFSDDSDGQSDFGLKIGHQGLFHDTDTGLVYNRARMLNPTLGRFNQRDPLGDVDGTSLYTYLQNQTTIMVDPQGTTGNPMIMDYDEDGVHPFNETEETAGPWQERDRCCASGEKPIWKARGFTSMAACKGHIKAKSGLGTAGQIGGFISGIGGSATVGLLTKNRIPCLISWAGASQIPSWIDDTRAEAICSESYCRKWGKLVE